MKNLLIIGALLFSTGAFAQSTPQRCAESAKEIKTFLLGRGLAVPMFDQTCFEGDPEYVKSALEAFVKNIDSSLNTIQSLEQIAKQDKIQYISKINELKASITKDLASQSLTNAKKNEYKMPLMMIGQDIAGRSRMVGNELTNAVAFGFLLEQFLPYLKNENEFIQRTLGYNSVEEVAQLRDLLVAFRTDVTSNVMEAELANAQYKTASDELGKLIEVIFN